MTQILAVTGADVLWFAVALVVAGAAIFFLCIAARDWVDSITGDMQNMPWWFNMLVAIAAVAVAAWMLNVNLPGALIGVLAGLVIGFIFNSGRIVSPRVVEDENVEPVE